MDLYFPNTVCEPLFCFLAFIFIHLPSQYNVQHHKNAMLNVFKSMLYGVIQIIGKKNVNESAH